MASKDRVLQHRTVTHNKEFQFQNVSRAEVGKPDGRVSLPKSGVLVAETGQECKSLPVYLSAQG